MCPCVGRGCLASPAVPCRLVAAIATAPRHSSQHKNTFYFCRPRKCDVCEICLRASRQRTDHMLPAPANGCASRTDTCQSQREQTLRCRGSAVWLSVLRTHVRGHGHVEPV